MKIDEIDEKLYTPKTKMRNDMIEGFMKDYEELFGIENSEEYSDYDEAEKVFWGCSNKDELMDKIYSIDIEEAVISDKREEELSKLYKLWDSGESENLDISEIDWNKLSEDKKTKSDEEIAFEKQALSNKLVQ